MAAPRNIKQKVQDAFELLIKQFSEGRLDGFSFHKGLAREVLKTPRIQIVCRRRTKTTDAAEILPESFVRVEVAVVTHYTDQTQEDHDRATGVIEKIWYMQGPDEDDTVSCRINNLGVADLVCTNVAGWTPEDDVDSADDQRKEFRTIFSGELECLEQSAAA